VTDEHRVTTFELFFDLVFVLAITQVSALLSRDHDALGILQAILLLALIWWSWSAYAWLGNQTHVDAGLVRAGMVLAMMAIFCVALVTQQAWHREPGGLDGPLVLAVAYIVVRLVHTAIYLAAAAGDPGLRRQLALNLAPLSTGAGLLVTGAILAGNAQTILWAAALAADWTGVALTSRGGGGWRLHSTEHWVERHGLIVLIALGESIVAIGSGTAGRPVGWSVLGEAMLGILVATALWWLYFDVAAETAAAALSATAGAHRVQVAIAAYTYSHFIVIAGIVVTAFGVREAIARTGEPLGALAAGALCIGPAVYLLGLIAFWLAIERRFKSAPLLASAASVGAWPLAALVTPVAALAIELGILSVLTGYETLRYAGVRRRPAR
jgi:low temperature requirement protein LtrA